MSQIRWGILGCGTVAGQFAEGLRAVPGARLSAVAAREGQRASAFAAEFGAERWHVGYEALVADPGVDVVYVATRNQDHERHCLLAIEAGKAVLCEKPFALGAAEGRRVVEAARRQGVFCMEGMWMRCAPAVREALSLLRDGAIGEPRLLTAALGFPYPQGTAGRLFEPPGGGALLDLGVYGVALAQAAFGKPTGVTSRAVTGAGGVDEQVSALLEYPGGRQALVTASLRSLLANEATVHGTAGRLRLEAPLYFPTRYRLEATRPHFPPAGPPRRRPLARLRRSAMAQALFRLRAGFRSRSTVRRPAGNGYDAEAAEVGRCLAAGLGESPILPLDDTLAVLETLDAIRALWTTAP